MENKLPVESFSIDIPREALLESDAPISLTVAAETIFLPGEITARTLRTEATRGNLKVFKVGGRLFTTGKHVKEMMDCLEQKSRQDYSSKGNQMDESSGLSDMMDGTSRQDRLMRELRSGY